MIVAHAAPWLGLQKQAYFSKSLILLHNAFNIMTIIGGIMLNAGIFGLFGCKIAKKWPPFGRGGRCIAEVLFAYS